MLRLLELWAPIEPHLAPPHAGIIHAAEEKDWKTAYSYFYEAFEGYDSIDNPKAITALKYMLLCKIMLNAYVATALGEGMVAGGAGGERGRGSVLLPSHSPEDVQALVSGKLALRYAGRQVGARL